MSVSFRGDLEDAFAAAAQNLKKEKPVDDEIQSLVHTIQLTYPVYGSKGLEGLAAVVRDHSDNPHVQTVAAHVLQSTHIQDKSVSLRTFGAFCVAARQLPPTPDAEKPSSSPAEVQAPPTTQTDEAKVNGVRAELRDKKISPTPSIKQCLVVPGLILLGSAVAAAIFAPLFLIAPPLGAILVGASVLIGLVGSSFTAVRNLQTRSRNDRAYKDATNPMDLVKPFKNMGYEAQAILFCRLGPEFQDAVIKDADRNMDDLRGLSDLHGLLNILSSKQVSEDAKKQAVETMGRRRSLVTQLLGGNPPLIDSLKEQCPSKFWEGLRPQWEDA